MAEGEVTRAARAFRAAAIAHEERARLQVAARYARVLTALRAQAEAVADRIAVARERGYRRLSLETGDAPAFAPARALYARFGFEPCGPYADYRDNSFSVFFTRELEPGR